MCLCVVLSTANLAHSWTHSPFILCALLWAFAQRHLMVEVIHNFWKPVLLASLFSAAVDSWLLLSSWSSTPSVCPQRHKVDICTLLTENHTVYPLKANFRVHLSSSRCSPVSWDVVPTTVSDFQLFCQPQSRLSISFSLYQAGLAWLMILTLFFHGTVRFVRFDGQKTPWAATVSKPVAQSTAPTLFSNLNNSIYAIATIHVSAMKPKNGSKKHSNIIWRSYWLLHLHALPLPYKIKQW